MPSVDTLVPVGAFALLVFAFEVKHLAADFFLQTNWMAQGKQRPSGWLAAGQRIAASAA